MKIDDENETLCTICLDPNKSGEMCAVAENGQ